MKLPIFGNRQERRAQKNGKAPHRRPTFEELPEGLREPIAVAQNFNILLQMLRAAHGIEGFRHEQVHGMMEWVRASEQGAFGAAKQHPRFREFFPDLADQPSLTLVDPSGQPIQRGDMPEGA